VNYMLSAEKNSAGPSSCSEGEVIRVDLRNLGLKHDIKGRSTSTPRNRREKGLNSPPAGVAWSWITEQMLGSPAFNALIGSASARVVFRVFLEHMQHGGQENGNLKVTFNDFEAYGIDRKRISSAINEAQALGFIERTHKGHRCHGDFHGRAATFRLTWLGTLTADGPKQATNEWATLTAEDVERITAPKRSTKSKTSPLA